MRVQILKKQNAVTQQQKPNGCDTFNILWLWVPIGTASDKIKRKSGHREDSLKERLRIGLNRASHTTLIKTITLVLIESNWNGDLAPAISESNGNETLRGKGEKIVREYSTSFFGGHISGISWVQTIVLC